YKYAGYVKDSWRVTNSLTLNLGLRYEYQHAFSPEQEKPVTPAFPTLFPAGKFPYVDAQTWHSTVPRVGMAWSIGTKNVVKASYGRYNGGMGSGVSGVCNTDAPITNSVRWRDPDGTGDYPPGEVNLDPINGGDFLSVSGSSNNLLNPDLRQPMTNEITAGFEREVMANVGLRPLYVYKDFSDNIVTANTKRPRSAYNIPITRRDPGPDGNLNTQDDGGKVTIFDYDAAYRGSACVANQRQNSPRTDHYQSMEFTLTKRASGRGKWFGMAAYWVT